MLSLSVSGNSEIMHGGILKISPISLHIKFLIIIPSLSLMTPGGETLVVTGERFGDVYDDITLQLVSDNGTVITLTANQTTASDTNLEAEIPSLPTGDYSVRVLVQGNGYSIE